MFSKLILLTIPLLFYAPLSQAHIDSQRDLLELDLPSLSQLFVQTHPSHYTLAYLSSDTIHRSGAKNLNELLKIFVPKAKLNNAHHFIMQINGETINAHINQVGNSNHLPKLNNIKLIEFICASHSEPDSSNVIAITTF